MKYKFLILFSLLASFYGMTQITLNACHPLMEDQDYIFNKISTDATGRNVFETTPVDGNQPCGGIGSCEFQMAWNNTNDRWEIYADDGNGTFSNNYILYFNTSASNPNPPSLNLGTWEEETVVTQSLCGVISSLTGEVQEVALGISDVDSDKVIQIFPNPASQFLNIENANNIETLSVYNTMGKLVLREVQDNELIDVSELNSGLYFVRIVFNNHEIVKKIIIE